MKKIFSSGLLLLMLFSSCSDNQVTDHDGNTYSIIKIGDQQWISSNLKVRTFSNGDTIPQAKTSEEWELAGKDKQPAWCYYGNNKENAEKYGLLYNWYAVTDPRGLAPEGFHIPSDQDWKILEEALGGSDKAGKAIKNETGWNEDEDLNSSGFSALPGGYRNYKGNFEELGNYGAFWSSTESVGDMAWYRYLFKENNLINRLNFNKEDGMSVRCVKNAE